jgi:hypothetical protein
MKFCKNLQQVVDISDPEWAPYWTNYKMMKKLIKELPSLVPSDDVDSTSASRNASQTSNNKDRADSPLSVTSSASNSSLITNPNAISALGQGGTCNGNGNNVNKIINKRHRPLVVAKVTKKESIGTSPGERAFFKLLRSELNKASRFFERAKQELSIREERIRDGIEIMKRPGSSMVNDKWSCMAKAMYRLYKDLLLLELFAIMSYTSFSKILKKHDKNTGYDTRVKFMANVVNKANFTHYPDLLGMISRCESKYEEIDSILITQGKSSSALDEDERLFISMIHRFYGQIMDKAEEEGADVTQRKDALGRRQSIISGSPKHKPDTNAMYSLQTLVEENDVNSKVSAPSACLSDDPDLEETQNDRKRPSSSFESVQCQNEGGSKKLKE